LAIYKNTNFLFGRYIFIGLVGNCVAIAITTPKSAKSNACSSLCLNGATCSGNASNITCICPSDYTGLDAYNNNNNNNNLQ